MYGMTCVIMATGVWLMLASYYEMSVSTTHSMVGGIIGMTLMSRGKDCVMWNYTKNEYCNGTINTKIGDFPWLDGVAEIVISWIISPVASGVCAAALYACTKYGVLIWENSFHSAKFAFPIIVGFTGPANTEFFLVNGTKGRPRRFRTSRYIRESKDGDNVSSVMVGCYVDAGDAILATCLLIQSY